MTISFTLYHFRPCLTVGRMRQRSMDHNIIKTKKSEDSPVQEPHIRPTCALLSSMPLQHGILTPNVISERSSKSKETVPDLLPTHMTVDVVSHPSSETCSGLPYRVDVAKAVLQCSTGSGMTWQTLTGQNFSSSHLQTPGDTTPDSGFHTAAVRHVSHPSSLAPSDSGTIFRRTLQTSQVLMPSRRH